MRLLRQNVLVLVDPRCRRHILRADAFENERARLVLGRRRHVDRVGAHVGDESDGLPVDRHTFVQLLSRGHGALRSEVELSAGLLLQRAGRKRWRWVPLLLALFD